MENEIILVTGGVKSGKSAYALVLGGEGFSKRAFIATATALDDEMNRKIAAHRQERGSSWHTIEEPTDVAGALGRAWPDSDVVIIDCLTLWISNLLTLENLKDERIDGEVERLLDILHRRSSRVIIVTNEVGLGIMPVERLSRRYQNLLGAANKRIAAAADRVFMMVSGIPVKIK